MASNSSHGSGDDNAETVVLKPGSQRAPSAAAGEEPTCVVNHGLQHRRVAHRPLQSSLRGPRRIGESPSPRGLWALFFPESRCRWGHLESRQ